MCMCVYVSICKRQSTQVYTICVFKQAKAVSRNESLLAAGMGFQQHALVFL